MNAGHTCIFHKGLGTMYFGAEKDNAVTLPHSAQRKHVLQEKSSICQRKLNFQQERKLL